MIFQFWLLAKFGNSYTSSNFIFWVCSLALRILSGDFFSFFLTKSKMVDKMYLCHDVQSWHKYILVTIIKMIGCSFQYYKAKRWASYVDKTCQIKGVLIRNGEWFSLIQVFWLLNLCEARGDASFAIQANLVYIFETLTDKKLVAIKMKCTCMCLSPDSVLTLHDAVNATLRYQIDICHFV